MNNQNLVIGYFIGLLVCLSFLPLTQSSAQTQHQTKPDNINNKSEKIICRFYLTMVRVRVSDQIGDDVSDLTKDDFIVYEDGVRQDIAFWTDDGDTDTEGVQPGYVIGYWPTNRSIEDELRRIRIRVKAKPRGKLSVVFWPQWYYFEQQPMK